MPYEVTKTVGRRAYRYRVESVRDPKTGKKKSRWIYIGRVCEEIADAVTPRTNLVTDRLLSALCALLETRDFRSLTVEAVAKRAKTTHATFYRHFRNMRQLLVAALKSAQQSLPSLDLHVTGEAEEERRKIHALIESVFSQAETRSGLLKALIQSRSDNVVLQGLWSAHMERLQRGWSVYIAELNAAELGRNDDAQRLAELVVMCIQARIHDAVLRNRTLTPDDSALWASAISRLILKP